MATCIISTAQQAKPKVIGHIEPWRAQLTILSRVERTYSEEIRDMKTWRSLVLESGEFKERCRELSSHLRGLLGQSLTLKLAKRPFRLSNLYRLPLVAYLEFLPFPSSTSEPFHLPLWGWPIPDPISFPKSPFLQQNLLCWSRGSWDILRLLTDIIPRSFQALLVALSVSQRSERDRIVGRTCWSWGWCCLRFFGGGWNGTKRMCWS